MEIKNKMRVAKVHEQMNRNFVTFRNG